MLRLSDSEQYQFLLGRDVGVTAAVEPCTLRLPPSPPVSGKKRTKRANVDTSLIGKTCLAFISLSHLASTGFR